jgi:membrane protease subunit HflK
MDQKPPFDFKEFKDFKLPKINVKVIGSVVIVILALVFIFSLWFTVEPEEVGVVLRFGKLLSTLEPDILQLIIVRNP